MPSDVFLGILCITSFSAFPTQLNQQVTSANLSEIGVMQRFLKSEHLQLSQCRPHLHKAILQTEWTFPGSGFQYRADLRCVFG